jgi:hypothetical protein
MASGSTPFPHLPIPVHVSGPANLGSNRDSNSRTKRNNEMRQEHSRSLSVQVAKANQYWAQQRANRSVDAAPIPVGVPLLLEIDPSGNIDWLITSMGFEIVCEEEDGYVLVATEDVDFVKFQEVINNFSDAKPGSGAAAKVFKIDSDESRLHRILSPVLQDLWPSLVDDEIYCVDVGIECLGSSRHTEEPKLKKAETVEKYTQRFQEYIITVPSADFRQFSDEHPRKPEETEDHYAGRRKGWLKKLSDHEKEWDALKDVREDAVTRFVEACGGEIQHLREGLARTDTSFPDTIEARLRLSGKNLRDFVLNFPYLFEVSETPEMEKLLSRPNNSPARQATLVLLPPESDSPVVGIIDSGIQENHLLLADSVKQGQSQSWVPGEMNEVGDKVAPSGHGTRVAGTVLFGESIPESGVHRLPFFLENIRVLDATCGMSARLHPATYLLGTIPGQNGTRIFNHSINSYHPCRLRHMSAWAATIDLLSFEYDILVVQSAGNIPTEHSGPIACGILNHLAAGRPYPEYLTAPSSRVATPGESLQAITVGSVSYAPQSSHFFATKDQPSSYSRSGFGIWNTTKPDVVEYGGDWSHDGGSPPQIKISSSCSPSLVRANLHGGPSHDRDEVGTSYAAPKVARLAAQLQVLLPAEPCLLYRALIAQSARWPDLPGATVDTARLRQIGYGIPNADRATSNTPFRITLITSGACVLRAGAANIYQVPIPAQLRRADLVHRIRIDVTLSYAARPRRTRRTLKRYLSTWLTWNVSKMGESLSSFSARILTRKQMGTEFLTGRFEKATAMV